MSNTQTHPMNLSEYNPTRNTRRAMQKATANMGTRYTCKTVDNQCVVWFPDVEAGIIVPTQFYRDFMLHVQAGFTLATGAPKNIWS